MFVYISAICAFIGVTIPIVIKRIESSNKKNDIDVTGNQGKTTHRKSKAILIILSVLMIIAAVVSAVISVAANSNSISFYLENGSDTYPISVIVRDSVPVGSLFYTIDGTDPSASDTTQKYEDRIVLSNPAIIIVQRRICGVFLGESTQVYDGIFANQSDNGSEQEYAPLDIDILSQYSMDELNELFTWVFAGMVETSSVPTDTLAERYEFVSFDWHDGEMMPRNIWNHYIRQPATSDEN